MADADIPTSNFKMRKHSNSFLKSTFEMIAVIDAQKALALSIENAISCTELAVVRCGASDYAH